MAMMEVMYKETHVLTKEQCNVIGQPVKTGEQVEFKKGVAYYEREVLVEICNYGQGDTVEKYFEERHALPLLGPDLQYLDYAAYNFVNGERYKLYAVKDVAKLFNIPVTKGQDIRKKPEAYWSVDYFVERGIPLVGIKPEWIHLEESTGMKIRVFVDVNEVLKSANATDVSPEVLEELSTGQKGIIEKYTFQTHKHYKDVTGFLASDRQRLDEARIEGLLYFLDEFKKCGNKGTAIKNTSQRYGFDLEAFVDQVVKYADYLAAKGK